MKRSNLIPITRIYDIYPKYTYSKDVKKFMDEIVDIDRANVYTKDEVIIERDKLLDKIRAEIDAESAKSFRYHNWERAKALEWALGILDKYKAESEE